MDISTCHIHFGLGRLSIGAVLPSLRPGRTLLLCVLASHENARPSASGPGWMDYRDIRVRLANTARRFGGFSQSFMCVRKERRQGDVTVNDIQSPSTLLILDSWEQMSPLLHIAASASFSLGDSQTTIQECFLGAGRQAPAPLLVFENQIRIDDGTFRRANWIVNHVVVDRICSKRMMEQDKVIVKCEEYLSMIAPNKIAHLLSMDLLWDSAKGCGIRLVDPAHLPFYALRKRALVNSVHEIVALFCMQILHDKQISAKGQVLPIVQGLLDKQPDLRHAISVYAGLQAIKLIWPLINQEANANEREERLTALQECYQVEHPQLLFDMMCDDVRNVLARFESEPDELSRLIDPSNAAKEVAKWKEHLWEPLKFVRTVRSKITTVPIYDRPSVADMEGLDNILSRAYFAAFQKAS